MIKYDVKPIASSINKNLLSEIHVRPAIEKDLLALEWDGMYTHFRSLYRYIYEGAIRGDSILWVVDMKKVGLIGQLFVQFQSSRDELANGIDRAYIYAFRIHPSFQGRGIGSYLLQFVEQDLRLRGFERVSLNVSRENHEARRLYERFGYRIVASEAGHWSYIDEQGHQQNVIDPAWRMEKELNCNYG